jgi:hypothetical protein
METFAQSTDRPQLTRRSPSSFDTANMPGLEQYLLDNGYRPLPPRISTEYGRLRRGDSLIVLYHSGAVVLQGADIQSPLRLLDRLAREGGQS